LYAALHPQVRRALGDGTMLANKRMQLSARGFGFSSLRGRRPSQLRA
jgi:hypothetical protein